VTVLNILGAPDASNPAAHEMPPLRIGDLAKATNKTTRALRLYEELGLLIPEERSAGGFRQYSATAVERVRFISKLQDLGLSLHDIKIMLLTTGEEMVPRAAMNHVQNVFQKKLADVSDQLQRLQKLQAELSSALEYLNGCTGCTAEEDGPSNCLSCDEHGQEESPSLVREVTKASSQLMQFDNKQHLPPRGSK
jgi:MerR family transcriptional regulator, copper efflux regulator